MNPTNGSRTLPPEGRRDAHRTASSEGLGPDVLRRSGHQDYIEEPDYDLNIVRVRQGQVLDTMRVIHVSRVSLLPYEQDIYKNGTIVEKVEYANYQKFGDQNQVNFPLSITITRPVDQYKVKLELSKLTLNPELAEDTFKLTIPAEGIKVTPLQ